MGKHILKYGMLLGLSIGAVNTFLYITDRLINRAIIFDILNASLITGFIIAGVILFKKNNDNSLNLTQALKVGIGISLLGGFITILWFLLLFNVFDTELIQRIEANELRKLADESLEITQEQIERKKEGTKEYTSFYWTFIVITFEHLFYGFVISLVTGLIIKQKKETELIS